VVPEHVSSFGDLKDYPVWDNLDLDSLPSGKLTRLWVVLAEDAMSSPIKVPVLVAKGVRPGPVVGLVSNETMMLNWQPLVGQYHSRNCVRSNTSSPL
jgi:hypothetical protein